MSTGDENAATVKQTPLKQGPERVNPKYSDEFTPPKEPDMTGSLSTSDDGKTGVGIDFEVPEDLESAIASLGDQLVPDTAGNTTEPMVLHLPAEDPEASLGSPLAGATGAAAADNWIQEARQLLDIEEEISEETLEAIADLLPGAGGEPQLEAEPAPEQTDAPMGSPRAWSEAPLQDLQWPSATAQSEATPPREADPPLSPGGQSPRRPRSMHMARNPLSPGASPRAVAGSSPGGVGQELFATVGFHGDHAPPPDMTDYSKPFATDRGLDIESLVLNLTPLALVSHLLGEPGGVDAVDEWGWTSLHKAAVYGKGDHVIALLDAGANDQMRTEHDPTHMYRANGPGRPGAVKRPSRFPYVNRFCMELLYGRAGRLTTKNGGFRPGQRRRWAWPSSCRRTAGAGGAPSSTCCSCARRGAGWRRGRTRSGRTSSARRTPR
jgi:hypothetical protein